MKILQNSGGGGSTANPQILKIDISLPEERKIYTGEIIYDVVKNLISKEIELSNGAPKQLFVYLPFDTDFFNKTVLPYVDNTENSLEISVLFELLKSTQTNNSKNILILKNVLPLLFNMNNHFTLHYLHSEVTSSNHLTLYPYYIILSDKVVLLSYDLNSIAIFEEQDFLEKHIEHHNNKIRFGIPLKVDVFEIENTIKHLLSDTIYEDTMYAISFEPCISAFVPFEMYNDLITDEFPKKDEFLNIIKTRLSQIKNVPKRYALFNKKGIDNFVNNGYIVAFKHPNLLPCNLEQRKIILTNILNLMDHNIVFMRAFSEENINISENYEVTNIQNHYDFSIMIYFEKTIRTLIIHESIISNCFIEFINDIIETDKVHTIEETKAFLKSAIKKLDEMIDAEK